MPTPTKGFSKPKFPDQKNLKKILKKAQEKEATQMFKRINKGQTTIAEELLKAERGNSGNN